MPQRVLLVATSPVLSSGLKRLLEEHGYEVLDEARDADQAVALAKAGSPDIAVVDASPPHLDGLEVARRIRVASHDTRILLLTGENAAFDAQEALQCGVWSTVQRSDGPDKLLEGIRLAAAGEIHWGPLPRESERSVISALSPRENEVFRLLAQGHSNREIAAALGISSKTVEVHRSNLMNKLGIHDLASLVRYAIRAGFIDS